jgi:apolipoprotein N-acyltransferase
MPQVQDKKSEKYIFNKKFILFLGALISGGLCVSAFPGSPAPLLAFVCMAPWLVTIKYARPFYAAVSGVIVGCLYAIPCTWNGIYIGAKNLNAGTGRTVIFTVLFFIPYLIPFAVVGLCSAVSRLTGIRRAFIGSAIWVAVMYAMPSVFPVTPGLMLHVFPLAIQLADISGVPMVNFVLFLINFLIAEIIMLIYERRRLFKEFGYLLMVIAITTGYGWFRLAAFQFDNSARSITVALIQPNLPHGVNEVGLIRDNRTQVISALEMTRRLLKTHPIDLAVFPETSIAAPCSESARIFRKLSDVAKETGVSFLYQCLDCQENSCYNAARMVFPHEKSPGLYRKRALIPFLEVHPATGFYRLLTGLAPVKHHFQAGTEKIIFQMEQGVRVIPLICYDVHFPERVREGDTGDLIAVLANDQNFGKSRIGYLDYAMNIFRAVEIRRPLLRVTNTGPSAIIQATGETVPGTLTPSYRAEARSATLHIPEEQTIYARYGDWFLYFLYGYILIEMLLWIRRKKC